MLNGLKINRRLILAIVIPVSIIVIILFSQLISKMNTRSEMRQLDEAVQNVAKIGNLIHNLQRERGLSVAFVSSSGAQMRAELQAQRKLTDTNLAEAKSALDRLERLNGGGQFKILIDQAKTSLNALPALRNKIDNFLIKPAEVFTEHSSLIAQKLIPVMAEVSKFSTESKIATTTTAYVHFVQGKEFAGQERATAAIGVSAGRFELPVYNRLLMLIAAQSNSLDAFYSAAAADIRDYYSKAIPSHVADF
jgi:hypothetical protein